MTTLEDVRALLEKAIYRYCDGNAGHELVVDAVATLESAVRADALAPRGQSPYFLEAMERLKSENARAHESDTTRLGLALVAEIERLQGALAEANRQAEEFRTDAVRVADENTKLRDAKEG